MQDSELQIQMEVEENELQVQLNAEEPEHSIDLVAEDAEIAEGNVNDVLVNGESVVKHKIANINLKKVNNVPITGSGNISIPVVTKTSDLTNNSGFITKDVNNLTNYYTKNETYNKNEVNSLLDNKAEQSAIPTKTSQLTNDSGFITKSVSNLTNYYLKSQTYNQSQINSLLNNKADRSDIPTKTSQLTNDSGFVTSTQMSNAIGEETTARQNADLDLQSQIDAITVSSDVVDVLGTYEELLDYDTSHLKANDVVKVLQDSTHNNAMSYYRWVVVDHVGHWDYVGSEGPFYTKSESDATFVPQTRTINNKALTSNITLTASDVGALPDSTIIPTVNNATLTIQRNGTNLQTFTANQSTDASVNITVPTDTSDLTNGAGYITGITSTNVTTALGFTPENVANKVTSISSSSTDTEYPSAKCVYDIVGNIETLLSQV